MKKITSTFFIALMLAFMLSVTAMADSYSDMPSDYSATAMQNAVDNGLLSGADGLLMPEENLTRAQLGAIVVRAFGASEMADLGEFPDVMQGEWYYDSLGAALHMKALVGGDGLMRPDDAVTRQEAFVVLARVFGIEADDTAALDAFSDKSDVAPWAQSAIAAMVEGGYVQGADGKINPLDNISRKDFAVVMDNLVDLYISEPGTYSETVDGSVMINTPDVVLQNMTISGNLIIGDGVGEDEVTLEDVTVEGETIVRGGGINSIYFKGTTSSPVVRLMKVDGELRLVVGDSAQTGTFIDAVYIDDGRDEIIIEGNFTTLTIDHSVPVRLVDAVIQNVYITDSEANGTMLSVTGTSAIGTLWIESANVAVDVDASAEITRIEAKGTGSIITGKGTVGTVNVNGNDVSVETAGTQVNVGEGVTGTSVDGEAVEGGESVKTPSGGSGSSSGGGSSQPSYTYNVSIVNTTGGEIMASVTETNTPNTEVTIYVMLDMGYALKEGSLKVTAPNGAEEDIHFTMTEPGTYTVTAEFVKVIESMELFVVDSAEDYARLTAIDSTKWPAYVSEEDANTDLSTTPLLATIVTATPEYPFEGDIVNPTFYRNRSEITDVATGRASDGTLYAATSTLPTPKSGAYTVYVGYKGAGYEAYLAHNDPAESTYEVTLRSNVTNDTLVYILSGEETITIPSVAQMEGYVFKGWYVDGKVLAINEDSTATFTEATTVTAVYMEITPQPVQLLADTADIKYSEIYAAAGVTLSDGIVKVNQMKFVQYLAAVSNEEVTGKFPHNDTHLTVNLQLTAPEGATQVSIDGNAMENIDSVVTEPVIAVANHNSVPEADSSTNHQYRWYNAGGELIAATEVSLGLQTTKVTSFTATNGVELDIALYAQIPTVRITTPVNLTSAVTVHEGQTLTIAAGGALTGVEGARIQVHDGATVNGLDGITGEGYYGWANGAWSVAPQ